jgi:hypothetical protein
MTYIRIGDKKIEAKIDTRREDITWDGRDSKAITIKMSFDEAMAMFRDGVKWSVVTEYTDDFGVLTESETEMKEYIIAGSVTDHRNGKVTVKMGAYKKEELQAIPLSEKVNTYAEAVKLRGVIEKTAQYIENDAEALEAKNLYPTWDELVAKKVTAEKIGFKFRYGGSLYKTIQPNISFVSHYVPGVGTESLFARIDEAHVGTEDDPIPYSGNMALENGKYYTEGGKVYRCTRDTVNPVYNSLSALVGLYVEVVE